MIYYQPIILEQPPQAGRDIWKAGQQVLTPAAYLPRTPVPGAAGQVRGSLIRDTPLSYDIGARLPGLIDWALTQQMKQSQQKQEAPALMPGHSSAPALMSGHSSAPDLISGHSTKPSLMPGHEVLEEAPGYDDIAFLTKFQIPRGNQYLITPPASGQPANTVVLDKFQIPQESQYLITAPVTRDMNDAEDFGGLVNILNSMPSGSVSADAGATGTLAGLLNRWGDRLTNFLNQIPPQTDNLTDVPPRSNWQALQSILSQIMPQTDNLTDTPDSAVLQAPAGILDPAADVILQAPAGIPDPIAPAPVLQAPAEPLDLRPLESDYLGSALATAIAASVPAAYNSLVQRPDIVGASVQEALPAGRIATPEQVLARSNTVDPLLQRAGDIQPARPYQPATVSQLHPDQLDSRAIARSLPEQARANSLARRSGAGEQTRANALARRSGAGEQARANALARRSGAGEQARANALARRSGVTGRGLGPLSILLTPATLMLHMQADLANGQITSTGDPATDVMYINMLRSQLNNSQGAQRAIIEEFLRGVDTYVPDI